MTSLLGRMLGDFHLETQIGKGALGVVYRARHVRRNQEVAVKVVHPNLSADSGFRERFQRVAGTAARLRHPHIVVIDDLGEHGGQFYIVMELLQSGSIRTLLERREEMLPLGRGVEYVRQAAEALSFAHGSGVLHRDMKPENILLVRDPTHGTTVGAIKVVDWGLTQLIDTGVTVVGNVTPGSPRYMSPEQCKGGSLDSRSDIYSLGVVLYEIATGYPPFQVSTLADAVNKHLTASPPPPRSVSKQVPEALEAIIMRCLAKKPDERYSSAAELAAALKSAMGAIQPVSERKIVWRGGDAPPPQAPPPPPSDQGRVKIRFRDEGSDVAPPPVQPPLQPPLQPPAAGPPLAGVPPVKAPPGPLPTGVDRPRIRVGVKSDAAPAPTLPDSMARGAGTPGAESPAKPPSSQSGRIKVMVDRSSLLLTPGQPSIVRITVANAGKTVDHFRISVDGVHASWVQTPPPPQLNPGERTTVALTVNVPKKPESHAGTYPVTVRATSERHPTGESGSAPGEWTVLPFGESKMTLAPARQRGWRKASFGVRLRNEGNTPGRFTLIGADDEQRLRYRFGHSQLTLGPGDGADLRMHVSSRVRWIGGSEPRAFMVRAEPGPGADGAPPPPQTTPFAAGQFVQRAIIPLWLPPLLILGAVALWLWLANRKVELLAVLPPSLQVAVGATSRVTASVTNKGGEALPDQTVTWSSNDTTVAAVNDSGVVEGRALGPALLTARRGRKTATVQVQVVAARVENLAVAPKAAALRVGGAARFTATARDGGGNILRRDVIWQSSDPAVATVGGNGRVVAKDTGMATITAMVDGKIATAEVSVRAPAGGGGGGGTEDCVVYEPGALATTREDAAGFIVNAGGAPLLTLDNESDARRALALARGYKAHCFLGRRNARPNRNAFIIEYWKTPTGAGLPIEAEDCVAYNRPALRVVDRGAQGWVLAEGRQALLLADTKEDAQKAWEVAQQHAQLCFIGRGNRRANQRDYIVQYWK